VLWVLRGGIVLLALALVVVCAVRHDRTLRLLRTYFLEPQPPFNLGLLRILVFGSLLFEAQHVGAGWFATLPAHFRRPRPGWGFLGHSLPLPERWVTPCQWLLMVALLLAMVGIFTRPAAAIAAIVAVPIFLIPNLYFKVSHGPQVLIQQAALLAASRSGDSLSVEAWLRRRRGEPPPLSDAGYTLPVRLSWLLMGTMYLFPGLWKLWVSGDQWVSGEKLRYEILSKWGDTPDFIPTLRVDRLPLLLAVLGTATLVVEIGFFFALFARSTRVWAAISAIGFHLGVGVTMGIWFNPIHPLIVLFDFPQVLEHPLVSPLVKLWRRAFPQLAGTANAPVAFLDGGKARQNLWPAAVVGGISLAGMLYTGARGINSYPFGVYPRFEHRVHGEPEARQELEFVVVSGNRRRIIHPTFAPLGDTGKIHVMLGALFERRSSKEFRERLPLVQRLVRENEGPFKRGDRLEIFAYDLLPEPALPKKERVSKRRFVARVPLD